MAETSYRESHKYQGKGAEYEQYYQTQAWQKFLWSREQQIILRVLDKYLAGREVHLLDFACGTGRIAGLLEDRVTSSTGVDVSGSMLAVAREKLNRTRIIEADLTAENILKPRRFNLITAFRFFLNAEPELRRVAMRALADLLDDEGYLVFNNHQNLSSPWTRLLYWRHLRKNPQGIFNVMSIQEMRQLVREAGLEIVEIFPVGFFHPPKVPVSSSLNRAIDNVASRVKFLSRFCESPVAVCRRRKNDGIDASASRK